MRQSKNNSFGKLKNIVVEIEIPKYDEERDIKAIKDIKSIMNKETILQIDTSK